MGSVDRLQLWQRPERAGTGPKPSQTRHGIAGVGLEIADAHGMTAVSVRAVANALGTGPASIYRYLKSHDELIELMIDTVSGEYQLALTDGTPTQQLLELSRQGRGIMLRHSWLAPLLLTRPSLGPNTLAYLDHGLAILTPISMTPAQKLHTLAMLTAITSAHVQNELASNTAHAGAGAASSAQYLGQIIQSGKYPHLTAAYAGAGEAADPEDVFERTILNYLKGAGLPAS